MDAPHLDRILDVENRYTRDENGNTSLLTKIAMSGEFNPMKIAAVLVGISGVFTFVAAIVGFQGHPGWTFAIMSL
ncbi:hypothetical protein, partial [Couchioplanes azureus]